MKQTYFNIPGWFNYHESYDMIVDQIDSNGKIVEIGSFLGRSTHYLAHLYSMLTNMMYKFIVLILLKDHQNTQI